LIQRAIGFNKAKVSRFFAVLEKVCLNESGERIISFTNIYNVHFYVRSETPEKCGNRGEEKCRDSYQCQRREDHRGGLLHFGNMYTYSAHSSKLLKK